LPEGRQFAQTAIDSLKQVHQVLAVFFGASPEKNMRQEFKPYSFQILR
jgi:hypothetical protein